MDCESFVLNLKTENDIKGPKNLRKIFDFSNLGENHEIFSNKNKKVVGKFKIETPKNIWLDEFIALRSECCACREGDDSKNNLKGISKSQMKKFKIEKYKNCLDGEENENVCDRYILKSSNHERHLHKKEKHSIFLMLKGIL